MANAYGYHVIKDTNQQAIIKLTGIFDGTTQEANTKRIQANSLFGALNSNSTPSLLNQGSTQVGTALPYYGLTFSRIWYDTNIGNKQSGTTPGVITVSWSATNAANSANVFYITGTSTWSDSANWATIPNNAGVDRTGDVGITTSGAVAGTAYTIIIEFRKDNTHYQRGHLSDPAAFNYGSYGVTP